MSIRAAIQHARKRVSLVNFGRGQCSVHRWSPRHNATWTSHTTHYARARVSASRAMLAEALEYLGWDMVEAEATANAWANDGGGTWTDVLRQKMRS